MGLDRPARLFLLSPAFVGGERAKLLLNPRATFALARQFHTEGLSIAEVFAFTSGLYFRGKIAYARWLAGKYPDDRIRIITSNAGLLSPDTRVSPAEVSAFGTTEIDETTPSYYRPLLSDAMELARKIGPDGQAILLGSIATSKYVAPLQETFGAALFFPRDFVGRGDMSRGALLLQAARTERELPYERVQTAVRTGPRARKVAKSGTAH